MLNDNNENKSNIRWMFLLAIFLILLDQATKLYFKGFSLFGWTHEGIEYGSQIPVIGTFLQWTLIENPGMAYGIEFGWGKIFLSLFSVVASIVLFMLLLRLDKYSVWIKLAFTLIFSGAVGNLIDRVFYGVFYGTDPLFYGKVVDFIQVDIPDIDFLDWQYFPIFNIADSCVTVGVCLLLIFHKQIPDFTDIFPKLKKAAVTDEVIEDSKVEE